MGNSTSSPAIVGSSPEKVIFRRQIQGYFHAWAPYFRRYFPYWPAHIGTSPRDNFLSGVCTWSGFSCVQLKGIINLSLKIPRYYASPETKLNKWQCTAAGQEVQIPLGWYSRSSDGIQDREIDTRIRQANAILREPYYSVVTKRELSTNAKLSTFKSVFVPILAYDYELCNDWKNGIPSANGRDGIFEKRSPCAISRQKAQPWNSQNPECGVDSPPNRETQLRWFGHVTRMHSKDWRMQVLCLLHHGNGAQMSANDQREWLHLRSCLIPLGVEPAEQYEIAENLEVFRILLGLM